MAQTDGDQIGCRVTVNGVVREQQSCRRAQRPDVLPGEVRMTRHDAPRPNAHRSRRTEPSARPIPHSIRIFAIPIILFWVSSTVIVNVIAPHARSRRRGAFGADGSRGRAIDEGDEADGQQLPRVQLQQHDDGRPGGPAATRPRRARLLRRDHPQTAPGPEHIQHIQDFWGDTLTAAGAQSADGKAAYVQVNLAGNQGTDAGQQVRGGRPQGRRRDEAAPPGVKAYVTGPAALTDDLHVIGNASLAKITLFTLVAIAGMLLVVYRSIVTTLIQLFLTFVGC